MSGGKDSYLQDKVTEERNPRTTDLDKLSTVDLVAKIQKEDFAVAGAVAKCIPEIARAVDEIALRLKKGGRLFYFGAGTSGRLGVLDASEWPPTFGVPADLVNAHMAGGNAAMFRSSEGSEDEAAQGAGDVAAAGMHSGDAVIGISAFGQTPYVVGALNKAGAIGALTILITNNPPTGDRADVTITAVVGPEAITGSTRMKAGTAQKMILNLISTSVMVKLGKVYENLMVDLSPTSRKLRERAINIICTVCGVNKEQAERALAAANNSAKTAILMLRRNINRQQAEMLLAAGDGFLRRALEAQPD